MESAVFIRKQMRNPGSEVETVLKNQTETLDLEREGDVGLPRWRRGSEVQW